MSGAAPGAKLVSVRACLFVAGCTAHALIEGMIYAVKSAHVDVINMSIGGLPALNDGNNARAELYNRLIEQYKVQMFILGRQQRPRNEYGRRSFGGNFRRQRGLLSESRDHAAWTTARIRRSLTTCTTSLRTVRARTADSSRRSSLPARLFPRRRCGSPAWVCLTRFRPATS